MGRTHHSDFKTRLILGAGTPLLKTWFSTVRVEILTPRIYERFFCSSSGRCIGATWHRGAIFLVYLLGRFRPMIMFSRSRDGELLARFAERMGVIPVRGSSSRGGSQAIRHMIRHFRRGGRFAATVADGPQGPAFRSKPGLVFLAQATGVPLLPIMWSSPNPITFSRSWDKTMIPRPFGTVRLLFGEPIHVPKGGAKTVHAYNRLLEERLNRMKEHVDGICGYGKEKVTI